MKLEIEGGVNKNNPDHQDIERLLSQLDNSSHTFAILSKDSSSFTQAAKVPGSRYLLEYREGRAEEHYSARKTLSLKQVVSVFTKYVNEDNSWKDDFEWQAIDWDQPKQDHREHSWQKHFISTSKNSLLSLIFSGIGYLFIFVPYLFEDEIEARFGIEFNDDSTFLFIFIGFGLMLPLGIENLLQWGKLSTQEKGYSLSILIVVMGFLIVYLFRLLGL